MRKPWRPDRADWMPVYVESPKGVFRSKNPAPFRILIISNCQAEYLAPFFEYGLQDCSCDYIICHSIASPEHHAIIEAHLEKCKDEYRIVISLAFSDAWLSISRKALIARFGRKRTFFILNLFFSGGHPDIVTLGDLQTRIMGPMGLYHSRIALGGWMAGLDDDHILDLFSNDSMRKLGYHDLFDRSANELKARERICDTNFSDQIVNLAKIAFAFYTSNHPTPYVLASYASHSREILISRTEARSSGLPLNAMQAAKTMVPLGIWPIYPELKDLFAPNFPVSSLFILPDLTIGSELISRKTFVQRSRVAYDAVGRGKIAEIRQAQDAYEQIQRLL